jgi:photosystem II stability/assembly factor-like uncharacterized protein
MHRTLRSLLFALGTAALALLVSDHPGRGLARDPDAGDAPAAYPSDWFFMQRSFPLPTIPSGKFEAAVQQARADRVAAMRAIDDEAGTLSWTQAGPVNIGGRVTAIAALPGGATVYLGSANGGVFKSTNSGANWAPVTDNAYGAYSIGAITIDPQRTNVIYAGSGESNGSVDSYDGIGLYRSKNSGATWGYIGLKETARIGRVAIDPGDTNRIYVAAMGSQFSTGPDRGLYRTEDGGLNWTKTLFVNDSTGACDVVINPAHPETVFCATWERVRHQTYRRAYGPGCGIWRSVNHGTTWTRLQSGLPAPSDDVGRIGLAIAASRPSTLYAQIMSGTSLGYVGLGMYRTLDGGDTWARRDSPSGLFPGNFGGFAWYFGEVKVDPTNPDRVFALGVEALLSTDGGVNYGDVTGASHVDQHALWIDPSNPLRVYLGNDGGFFSSSSGGGAWTKSVDLPITQFYAGTVAALSGTRLLGGTQDNGTLGTSGSTSWSVLGIGGDGFQCLVDPTNTSVVFAEWQFCCDGSGLRRSTNGGTSFSAASGFIGSDRYNWSTPIAMNPRNHNLLLVGSQRVYRSTNNGVSYAAISGDLSTNPVTSLVYGTIATLEISAADTNTYYAGTDDGKVWRSINRGAIWTDVSAGLPVRSVTRVSADPSQASVVYATLSGFGSDEHLPHVFRSSDRGSTWASISSDLPDAPANDLLVDPLDSQTLFLATDVGMYVTRNQGASWFPLGQGMPVQTVFDLSLHAPTRTLIAATHGRSQWKLDLTQLPVAAQSPAAVTRLSLGTPVPNPSRGEVRLALELPSASSLNVEVYDVMGRRVCTLARGRFDAGQHPLTWDGRDDRGRSATPGIYFVRVRADGAMLTRRVARIE